MTTENNKKESEVMEGMRFTLKEGADRTVYTIHSIVEDVAYIIWPKATRMQGYAVNDVKGKIRFGDWVVAATPPSIEGEIKSLEQLAFEKFPVKLGQMSGIDLNEDERMAYLQGLRDASQFTASKDETTVKFWKDKYKEANEFICDIGKLLGQDGLGFDDLSWSLEDFENAIKGTASKEKEYREALEDIIKSWDERANEREQLKHFDGLDYWSPAASMVESKVIAAARKALNK